MKWNGRTYRPANAQFITKKKPFDFQEALKPYGEKQMPAWNAIVGVNNEVSSTPVPDTTPTPTPSNTPTGTPNPTGTPTGTPTNTPTRTAAVTPTPTNTGTPTSTPTPTTTLTSTPTLTPTTTPTPSATQPFTPSNIPDLFIWFDASNSSKLVTRVSGGETFVTTWSGNTGTYSVANTTAADQPKLVAGAYGLPYSGVTFSGGTDNLSSNSFGVNIPSGNTTFMVAYVPNENNALLYTITGEGGGGALESITSLYANANTVESRAVGSKIQKSSFSSLTKAPKLLMGVSGNTSTRAGTFNDTSQSSTSTFTSALRYGSIRFSTSAGEAPSNGAIYEVMVFNRLLTSAERDNIFTYLKTKWNYSTW